MIFCGNNPTKSMESSLEEYLFPIGVGNSWKYLKFFNSPEIQDTLILNVHSHISIMTDKNDYIAGVFNRRYSSGAYISFKSDIEWNGQKGLYTLGSISRDDTIIVNKILKFKYPVKVGDKWEYPILNHYHYIDTQKFIDTTHIECVAENYKIETSIDTYNTIVYYYPLHQVADVICLDHYFYYFCPGIGMIKQEIYSSPDSIYLFENRKLTDLNSKFELIEYHLNDE